VSPDEYTEERPAEDGVGRSGFTRRQTLIGGAIGVGGFLGAGALMPEMPEGSEADAAEPSGTIALPTTTAPEQLRLAWGADPATQVTVSWSAPGTVPMLAPMLAYSTEPITASNPGAVVFPADPEPLSLAEPREEPCATSFTDGPTGSTTYHYHVPLSGLEPDTKHYYQVSDGSGNTAEAWFQTAPTGRAAYRFTAFGDHGTPLTGNPSGYSWSAEGSSTDVPRYNVEGTVDPGDGQGPGLFHILVGDISYADNVVDNHPAIWRDWGVNASGSAQNRPWMHMPGNHEMEDGATDITGRTLKTTKTSSSYFNGPYGFGNYFSRFVMPDNGVTNWDGNSLQGCFYSFQVGTVLFICMNAAELVWQYGKSGKWPYYSSGGLAPQAENMQLIPDTETVNSTFNGVPLSAPQPTPNLQIQWLEEQLQAAYAEGSTVEMIVVSLHMSVADCSNKGSGTDMGLRAAVMPLLDKYGVDLVLVGHNHDYARSYPVRGYDPPAGTTTEAFTSPFASYTTTDKVDTRRPTVVSTEPFGEVDGTPAWDTSQGLVCLAIGGGGAASDAGATTDSATHLYEASIWAAPGVKSVKEDGTWQAYYDTAGAWGYAVFDVDPGNGPGETSITFQWYQVTTAKPAPSAPLVPAASNVPEKFVFTRLNHTITPGEVVLSGDAAVGQTVTVEAGTWTPATAALTYEWMLDGTPITDADGNPVTGETYVPMPADAGHELSVLVTAMASGYETATSSSHPAVVAEGDLGAGTVTVSGAFWVAGTVTAATAGWPDAEALSYRWLSDGTPIGGAESATYQPAAGDAGKLLQVQVTGTATGYRPVNATSAPQTVSANTPGASALKLSIAGEPKVGDAVKASVSAAGVGAGLSYQWLLDGEPIKGATSASYVSVPADATHQLQVQVSQGSSGTVVSAAEVVRPALFEAWRPGVSGEPRVGGRITAVPGNWKPKPELSYQWLLDGHPIRGEDDEQLELLPRFVGSRVSVRVTAKRTGYLTQEQTSEEVPVMHGEIRPGKPKIIGRPWVDDFLQVTPGEWNPKPEFTYRWLVNGSPVDAPAAQKFRVRPEDRGKRISVEVTGHLHGYRAVGRRTANTDPARVR
jgi:hypothetical protein